MDRLYFYTMAVLDAALILQLLQMSFAVWADSYISRYEKKLLLIIGGIILALLFQGQADFLIGEHIIDAGTYNSRLPCAVSAAGYVMRPVVIALFIRLSDPGRKHPAAVVLCILNALVYITSIFVPIAIDFNDNGVFTRGPLGYTCLFVSFVLLLYLFVLSFKSYNYKRWVEMIIPLFITAVIITSACIDMLLDINLPVSFLMCAITCGCVFYYLWLHLKFAREHETSLLAESRIRIMMSQIQPHFLYNTLSTIQALCRKDPELAASTVEKLGDYLRQNLASLGEAQLIPFKKELEHTRIYTEIESLMFPELELEYRINDYNFLLPALSIQPLVENAIRHGIRGIKGGRIEVVARRDDDHHTIIINDNGKGFDTGASIETGGGRHIGIRNVRERVEKMCGGTLTVESSPGNGTTVMICIPFREDRS